MSRHVQLAALLLSFLFLFPMAAAEPGKDPNDRSENAPGQNKDKPHPSGPKDDGQETPEEPQAEEVEWRLNLLLEDLSAIDEGLLRVVAAHLDAGVPVTVEPGTALTGILPSEFGPLQELVIPSPQAAPMFGPSSQPMSASDCDALIIGVMNEPPYLNPGVRPECLNMDSNIPLGNGFGQYTDFPGELDLSLI